MVIFNHEISAVQHVTSSRRFRLPWSSRRTGLILDIFAQRARTHEGKLQVELAQLTHMSTRLVRVLDTLDRQKGGIGLRGPGEKQIELTAVCWARIKSIQARLGRCPQSARAAVVVPDVGEAPRRSIGGLCQCR